MVTTLNFKDIIDLPKWRSLSTPSSTIAISSSSTEVMSCDFRNNEDRHPYLYLMNSSGNFMCYNTKNDGWQVLAVAGLAAQVTSSFFMSAWGPRGTITTTGSNNSFTLSTVLPATVGRNQLANRGDGIGFKVRIIGSNAGSSGKTEERYIIANTGETTAPTIIVDNPFSFIPATGDKYEILSGRIYFIGQSNAAGSFKYYDVATNSFSGNLSTTNIPANFTEANLVGLDELLVPYDRNPGEGFFGTLTATASGATSLTGQAIGGDAIVVANQYRNFQIRIVQDTAIPTAAGQRRNITSHTAGASPIYTVPAWSVTPSVNAQYVIENNGDRMILWTTVGLNTNTYTISTGVWDVAGTIFANRAAGIGAGFFSNQAFSIEVDTASPPNVRNSYIYSFRAGSSSTLDIFDIAGAATGTWILNTTYGNAANPGSSSLFQSGSNSTLDPATNQGRYMYINRGAAGSGPYSTVFVRFDMKNQMLEPFTNLRFPLSTVATSNSQKIMAYSVYVDGTTKLSFIFFAPYSVIVGSFSKLFFGLAISR